MSLATMTPAQIDEQWLPLMGRIDTGEAHVAFLAKQLKGAEDYNRDRLTRLLAEETAKVDALQAEAAPFEREWERRGGWVRYYLVQNGDGHYHRSMHCSTCFATTQFVINPMTSGLSERELVDLVGTDACTTCFPFAPSTAAFKSGVSLGKAEKDSRRDAKTAARIEKAEKKVAYWEKTMERLRAKMVKLGGDPDFTGEPVDVFLVSPYESRTEAETDRYYLGSDIKNARESLQYARRELEKAGEPVRQRGAFRERPAWTGRPR